ncbi:hypothetical protein [Thermococcus gorgonarius]|uniref:hypothetical protein n=1 Tax=Thermococcus gorgonarius TaxID=71997 RepID=UPI001E455FE8|nr:hypothetical protein [Thermococcus gorgonarius]
MGMEEVKELKDVLERIEGKLIAVGKMYGARNFGAWISVMLFYYVILGLFEVSWRFNLIYWPVAFAIAMTFTRRVWKRFKRRGKVTGREVEVLKTGTILMVLSWTAGTVLGGSSFQG